MRLDASRERWKSSLKALFPLLLMIVATSLEASGDAIIRIGFRPHAASVRVILMLAGAITLYCYGLTLNLSSLDWGRLIGGYVAIFFLVGQIINVVVFNTWPTLPIVVGGAFIIAGGLIITAWQR